MAARTKTTAKKKASRTTRGKASVSRLDRLTIDLPPTLREFAKQVRIRLNRIEKRTDRAQTTYRNQVAHLIRVASQSRKQVIRVLSRLEKLIRPQTKKIR